MNLVIVGNGISGTTLAREVRKKSNCGITIISSETKYFFSRTALMYVYMGHMRWEDLKPYEDWFWPKNKINLIKDHIENIDFKGKKLYSSGGLEIPYDQLVLALGSKPNKFGWPGQDLKRVSGLYHKQDLKNLEKYTPDIDRAVIVGGGLIGLEMAEMFRSRDKKVTMIVREQNYWDNVMPKEEAQMISGHIIDHDIDLRLGTNLGEIKGNDRGEASSIVIKESGEEIPCQYVGLTAGVSPNVDWLKQTELEIQRGIVVDRYLKTNLPGVYAIGDCAQLADPNPGRRNIEAVWYTGKMMGKCLANTLTGTPQEYDPGIWYNSAKFLDIEYQVYGQIPNHTPDGITSLYWRHPVENKSIRINYETGTKKVLGFNLMGIRMRHKVCEKWIADQTKIDDVLQNLPLANFDPEFYKMYEKDLIDQYNKTTGENLQLKSQRKLSSVLKFLSA